MAKFKHTSDDDPTPPLERSIPTAAPSVTVVDVNNNQNNSANATI